MPVTIDFRTEGGADTLRPCAIGVGTREESEKVEAEADEENAIGTAEQLVILLHQNATIRVMVVRKNSGVDVHSAYRLPS